MSSKINSMLKEKFGITKSSAVTLTEKDDLYSSCRKIAKNIFKNGQWTKEDYKEAVLAQIKLTYGGYADLEIDFKEITDNSYVSIGQYLQLAFHQDADLIGAYRATISYTLFSGKKVTTVITYLVDGANKIGSEHGSFYKHKGYFEKVLACDRYAVLNADRLIGYWKLFADMKAEYQKANKDDKYYSETQFKTLSEMLSKGYYGKKQFKQDFVVAPYAELSDEFFEGLEKDTTGSAGTVYIHRENGSTHFYYKNTLERQRRRNNAIKFMNSYIAQTYNIILQAQYEADVDKVTRAKAWQTKKHINKSVIELMDTTSLKEHYNFVELDNEVDLELFKTFEDEMEQTIKVLPTSSVSADLRLRKLGNYCALGLYQPNTKTIALDFRQTAKDLDYSVGIRSFIHEYGHHLDYTVSEDGNLSMQDAFAGIVKQYQDNLNQLDKTNEIKKKATYYSAPTEVFARAFEIYMASLGFDNSFINSFDYYCLMTEYSLFNEAMREELIQYFDKQFPALRESVISFRKQ